MARATDWPITRRTRSPSICNAFPIPWSARSTTPRRRRGTRTVSGSASSSSGRYVKATNDERRAKPLRLLAAHCAEDQREQLTVIR